MDVRATTHTQAADGTEELALYRAAARHVTEIALRLADDVEAAPGLSLTGKAEALERLARVVRRNALLARRLREPLRTESSARRGPGRAGDRCVPLSELSDAELEALETEALEAEALERLDPLEQLEDIGNRSAADLLDESCRDLGLGSYADLRAGRSQPDIALLYEPPAGQTTAPPSPGRAAAPSRHPDPPLAGPDRPFPSVHRLPARNQDTS